jgi:hypothetical protein
LRSTTSALIVPSDICQPVTFTSVPFFRFVHSVFLNSVADVVKMVIDFTTIVSAGQVPLMDSIFPDTSIWVTGVGPGDGDGAGAGDGLGVGDGLGSGGGAGDGLGSGWGAGDGLGSGGGAGDGPGAVAARCTSVTRLPATATVVMRSAPGFAETIRFTIAFPLPLRGLTSAHETSGTAVQTHTECARTSIGTVPPAPGTESCEAATS